MAFKRSRVRLPSAPLCHSNGLQNEGTMARAPMRDASGSPRKTSFFLGTSYPAWRRPASLDRALVAAILVLLTCVPHATLSAAHTTGVVAVAAPTRSRDVTWTNIGPDGGRVNHMQVDATKPQHLLAAADTGGVFESQDGGASWQYASDGLPDLRIAAVAFG